MTYKNYQLKNLTDALVRIRAIDSNGGAVVLQVPVGAVLQFFGYVPTSQLDLLTNPAVRPPIVPPLDERFAQLLKDKADLVGGKVPEGQLPRSAFPEYKGSFGSELGMLSISGEPGDFCVRTDDPHAGMWVLHALPSSDLANWVKTGSAPDWNTLPNKPSTFPPSAHTHAVVTGHTVWVDAANGNDLTGAVGNMGLPFASIPAALAAASSGDLVHVRPGTYAGQVVLKNGVNLHLESGVLVTLNGGSGATVTDAGVAVICAITGNGRITRTGVVANAVLLTNTGSFVYLECSGLFASASATGNACIVTSANLVAKISGSIGSSHYDALIVDGGGMNHPIVYIEADSLDGAVTDQTDGQAVEMGGGDSSVFVRARKITGHSAITDVIYGSLHLDIAEPFDWAMISVDSQGTVVDLSGRPQIVFGNRNAACGQTYHVFGESEFADPPAPREGEGYQVVVFDGPATVDSVAYPSGRQLWRVYNGTTWETRSHAHTLADLPVAANLENSATKLVRADDSRLHVPNLTVTEFTATAGQTVFNVTYTVGAVHVRRNGVFLSSDDFTASNGTSITLGAPCADGDTVVVWALNALANAVDPTLQQVAAAGAVTQGLARLNIGLVFPEDKPIHQLKRYDGAIVLCDPYHSYSSAGNVSQQLYLTPFYGDGRTITSVTIYGANAAASGSTYCAIGIYAVDNWLTSYGASGSSLVAITDTNLSIVQNANLTANLTNPYQLQIGQRYMMGVLQVAATPGQLRVTNIVDGLLRHAVPNAGLFILGLSELPATLNGAGVGSFGAPIVHATL